MLCRHSSAALLVTTYLQVVIYIEINTYFVDKTPDLKAVSKMSTEITSMIYSCMQTC